MFSPDSRAYVSLHVSDFLPHYNNSPQANSKIARVVHGRMHGVAFSTLLNEQAWCLVRMAAKLAATFRRTWQPKARHSLVKLGAPSRTEIGTAGSTLGLGRGPPGGTLSLGRGLRCQPRAKSPLCTHLHSARAELVGWSLHTQTQGQTQTHIPLERWPDAALGAPTLLWPAAS